MRGLKGIVNAIFDTVLPRRQRRMRTESRTIDDIPLSPTPHNILGVRITTIMDYQMPQVQDLIRTLKYDGSKHAARLAAALLADYIREELVGERSFSAKKIALVPVPLFKTRERERGWNQIELVLRALPEEMRNGPLSYVVTDALTRTRETKPQTRLHRSERLSNVAGAFSCEIAAAVEKTRVFLIDDVTTTGATLANAATPLRRAGANVSLIALARA